MNKKTKEVIFAVVALLTLLKFILLFATGGIFGIVTLALWLTCVSLVIVLIFMWFLYGWAFRALYRLKFIIILWLSLGILLCVIGFSTGAIHFSNNKVSNNSNSFTASPSNSSTGSSTAKCASTGSDQPASVSGIVTDLFVSPLNETRSFTEGVRTETRTFSLADYANEKANPVKDWRNPIEKTTLKEDVFFDIHKPDSTALPRVSGNIQLCDNNNMLATYPLDYEKPSLTSESATGGIWYLHGGKLPKEPGDYRVDAYLYYNGKWTLTNRIDKITFTK